MSRPELSAEDLEYLRSSRAASGVDPEKVTDSRAISKVAALITNSQPTTNVSGGSSDG